MSAGKAIFYILSNHVGTAALVDARIYPDMATQKAAYPFIVYSVTATRPTDTKDGSSVLDEVSVSVMCYASTYTASQDIAEQVRTALDRTTGTYSGVAVDSIRFDDQRSAEMEIDKHVFITEQAYTARIVRSR